MSKNEQRWLEIQFAILCYKVYNSVKQYPLVMEYLELLADIARMPRDEATRLLQNVMQKNRVNPSKIEFVALAREHGMTIEQTLKTLRISKKTYLTLVKQIPDTLYVVPQHSVHDVELMEKLLNAHNLLQGD